MLTKILPPLSAETYNLYWFGLLVLTVAMSGVAVIGPNLVQKRNHKALAGWNDFFTRHQLGYISYCFAIFISGPLKSEQKSLKVLIAVVAILALLFFLIGLYWASPSRLRKCLTNAQHICPQSTEEECDKPVSRRKKWQILWLNVLFSLASFGLSSLLAFAIKEESPPQPTVAAIPSKEIAKQVATDVKIGSVTCGDSALQDTRRFLHDHIYQLQEERRGSAVCIVESESLASYQGFRWDILLLKDFESAFGLSVREGAYLVESSKTPILVRPLTPRRPGGPPYHEISMDVPESETGARVVVVLSVYATSPESKFLTKIGPMLTAHVE